MHLYGLVCASVLLLTTPQHTQPAQDEDISAYILAIKGRTHSLRTLYLPFTAHQYKPGSSEVVMTWKGHWCRFDNKESARWEWSRLDRDQMRLWQVRHSIWDGVQLDEFVQYHHPQPITSSYVISREKAGAFVSWLPPNFGLQYFLSDWHEVLRPEQVTVLGTEEVSGRTCTKVLWNPGLGSHNGIDVPIHLWIDMGESLLIWKTQYFNVTHDSKGGSELLEMNGKHYIKDLCLTLLTAAKINQYWVPTKGLQTFPGRPDLNTTEFAVDTTNATIDTPIERSLISLPTVEDASVRDEVRNETRFPNLRSKSIRLEANMEHSLMQIATQDSTRLSMPPPDPQPVLEVSCGHKMLYALLRLSGASVSLNDIVKRTPNAQKSLNLQEMSDITSGLGLATTPAHFDKRLVSALRENSIVHVSRSLRSEGDIGDSHQSEGHFVLAKYIDEDKIRLYSFPDGVLWMSAAEFSKLWSGYAVVRSGSDVDRTKAGHNLTSGTYWLIACTLLVVGTAVVIKSRRTGFARLLILSIPAFLCSCGKPAPAAGSPQLRIQPQPSSHMIQVDGESTFDFGEVLAGAQREHVFSFKNAQNETLSITTKPSCGCTYAQLSKGLLPPGQSSALTIRIDTSGRDGGLMEYVDVLSKGKRIHTFWISGSVRARMTVVPTPASIDIGAITLGTKTTKDITLEVFGTHDFGDIALVSNLEGASSISITSTYKDSGKEQIRLGRSMRTITCSVTIAALSPGPCPENTQLVLSIAEGTLSTTLARIPIHGRVIGKLEVSRDCVYFGVVSSAFETELTIRTTEPSSEAVEVTTLSPDIEILKCDKVSQGVHNLRIRIVGDTKCRGWVNSGIVVTCKPESVTLPVNGRIWPIK